MCDNIQTLLRWRYFPVLLIALWAGAYLPGLGARDLRLEESRRATPARQMQRSGDYVTPRLYGETYLSKPPGYFWLVAGVQRATGCSWEAATRIPAVLGALGGALLLLGFARRELPKEARALAALLLLSISTILDKSTVGEIDSLLSMLVAAALVVFYEGYSRAQAGSRRALPLAWLGVGLLTGLMVLLKGPGGPLEFVPPLLAFLLWERKLKWLFSPWLLVAVALAALPTGLWVWQLLASGGHNLVAIWSDQLGLDVAQQAASSGHEKTNLVLRYLWQFPTSILGMTLPWIIWAVLAMLPGGGTGLPRPLWRFLVCGISAMVLPFYLWPAALGRHLMAVAYPVSVLAAAYLVADQDRARPEWTRKLLLNWAGILDLAPLACGIAGVVVALLRYRPALPGAVALALGGATLTVFLRGMVRRERQTPAHAGVVFAAMLALALLCGRALASVVLLPLKAHSDETRLARLQLEPLVRAGEPVYTLEYFTPRTSGTFYNLQFYVGPELRALRDVRNLPAGKIVTVLGTTEHIAELWGSGQVLPFERVGQVQRKGRTLLEVVRMARPMGPPPPRGALETRNSKPETRN